MKKKNNNLFIKKNLKNIKLLLSTKYIKSAIKRLMNLYLYIKIYVNISFKQIT